MTERRGDDEPAAPDPWAGWPRTTPEATNDGANPQPTGTPPPPWLPTNRPWPEDPAGGSWPGGPSPNRFRVPGWLARPRLAAVAIGLFAAAVLYRYYVLNAFNSWTIFFHGLPMILALALALVPAREASPTGRVFVGTTYALLLTATVSGEGSICIFIAAPFIYLMVGLITALIRWIDPRKGRPSTYGVVLPVVLVASLASGASQPPPTTVTAAMVVDNDAASVVARLASPPVVPPVEAGFLAMGFPQPVDGSGGGLEVGDRHRVTFSDGGTLTLEVAERQTGSVTFVAVEDTTMIGQWITWQSATFRWEPTSNQLDPTVASTTEVTLELTYRRLLQPGWYFGPIVEAGADRAAAHLLASRLA